MKKTIFTLVLSLFLIFLTIEVNAQQNYSVMLAMPAAGKLNVQDFWGVTIINNSGSEQSVYLVGTATENKDGQIAKGTTVPFIMKKGTNNIKIKDLPKTPDVEYTAKDTRYKNSLIRAGEFPSGKYEICLKVFFAATNEELGSDCINQEVLETELITLINPTEGEDIDSKVPVTFTWSSGGKIPEGGCTLRICEVMENQTPETAMKGNKVWFEQKGIKSTTFTYPNSAKVFEEGKKYAWVVKNGSVKSEVYSFGTTIKNEGLKSITFIGKYYLKYNDPTYPNSYKRVPKVPIEIYLKDLNSGKIIAKTTTDLSGRFKFNDVKVLKSVQIQVGSVEPYVGLPGCYVFTTLPSDVNTLTPMDLGEVECSCSYICGPIIMLGPPPFDNCTFPPCPWEAEAFGILEAIDAFAESVDNNYPNIENSKETAVSLMKKANVKEATIAKVLSRFQLESNQYNDSSKKIAIISPKDGEEINTVNGILFEWRDCKLCPPPVAYSLKVAEMLGDQSPEDAMKTNPKVIEIENIKTTSYQYPPPERKLEQGKKYAWMVTNGNGNSEVGFLVYGLTCYCKDSDGCGGKCTNCSCAGPIMQNDTVVKVQFDTLEIQMDPFLNNPETKCQKIKASTFSINCQNAFPTKKYNFKIAITNLESSSCGVSLTSMTTGMTLNNYSPSSASQNNSTIISGNATGTGTTLCIKVTLTIKKGSPCDTVICFTLPACENIDQGNIDSTILGNTQITKIPPTGIKPNYIDSSQIHVKETTQLHQIDTLQIQVLDPICTEFSIGQNYGGGIIFYIDSTCQHGLIAAQIDQQAIHIPYQNDAAKWAPYWGMSNTNGTAVGTGQSNTSAIVAMYGNGYYAASLSDQLILNGYSDWFLPSKDELELLYLNRDAVGGFVDFYHYWSSSEWNATHAWQKHFPPTAWMLLYNFTGTNGQWHCYTKLWGVNVRSIRKF